MGDAPRAPRNEAGGGEVTGWRCGYRDATDWTALDSEVELHAFCGGCATWLERASAESTPAECDATLQSTGRRGGERGGDWTGASVPPDGLVVR